MKKSRKSETITTFIGSEAKISGIIEFQGSIRVDGEIEGEIRSKNGRVIIGENAVINADINVDTAIIMGKVNGTIMAGERIEVYPPSQLVGDIRSPIISIDAGVMFNGKCVMETKTLGSKKKLEKGKALSLIDQGDALY